MKLVLKYIDYKKMLNTKSFYKNGSLIAKLLIENRFKTSQKTVTVDSDVSKEWLDACMRYLLEEIAPYDRMTLFSYSINSFFVINDLMNGGDIYKKEFTVRQVKGTSTKDLIRDAFITLKDEPQVKKVYEEWVKAEEEESEKKMNEFKTWLYDQPEGIPYDKIQDHYNESFYQQINDFLPQMKILDIHTIPQLRKEYLSITLPQWRRVLVETIKDINRIFKGAPPLPEPLTVYRGLKQRRPKTSWKGLVSTTLSKKVANQFTNQTKKCCLQTIVIPKGGRVLPIFSVSAFNILELEILLQSYPSATRKNKS